MNHRNLRSAARLASLPVGIATALAVPHAWAQDAQPAPATAAPEGNAASRQPRPHRGDGFAHPSRRCREREPGHHARPRRHRENRQADDRRPGAGVAGDRRRGDQPDRQQRWWHRCLDRGPARLGLAAHAGADQRPPRAASRWRGRRRGRQRDPGLGGGTHRSADGRRVVRVRIRCDRRRRQLHHAQGLRGTAGHHRLRHLRSPGRPAPGCFGDLRPGRRNGQHHRRRQLQQVRRDLVGRPRLLQGRHLPLRGCGVGLRFQPQSARLHQPAGGQPDRAGAGLHQRHPHPRRQRSRPRRITAATTPPPTRTTSRPST